MKPKLIKLSRDYLFALQKYLAAASPANLRAGLKLGRRAVSLHLETLELARIHEQAFFKLNTVAPGKKVFERAQAFFTEAIVPIVETHQAAQSSKLILKRLQEMLSRSTLDLAARNRQLKAGIVRRKHAEAAFKKNGEDYARLLKESLQMQDGFRQLTHEVLTAQENERKKISRELQNEVAQTLLGVGFHLHSLKREAAGSEREFKNEIASTQRLVVSSAKSVRMVAKRLGRL